MDQPDASSTAFENGGWIPTRNSGYSEDISPQINIEGLTKSAVSLILTLDDIGHPIFQDYSHWVALNLTPISVIPEHLPKGTMCQQPIHLEQELANGKHCYREQNPPFNWNRKRIVRVIPQS